MSIILPHAPIDLDAGQEPIRDLLLLELYRRSQRPQVMIPALIARIFHLLRRDPRILHLIQSKRLILRQFERAFRIYGDGVAVAEDSVNAELPALQVASIADVCDEGHLVHGEPFLMPDTIGTFTLLVPVTLFPVVESQYLSAAL